MEVLAIVPARGGSKSVPRKNVRLLAGQPLIAYTLNAAHRARSVNRTVVTTDDEEIADVARAHGAEVPFRRPPELGLDHVTDLPVFQHCLGWLLEHEQYRPDIVVHLRPTAPLRQARHIDEAVQLLLDSPDADSVRSVAPAPQHPLKMWRSVDGWLAPFVAPEVHGFVEAYNLPRQVLPEAFVQNGSVDVVRAPVITEQDSMSGQRIRPYVMDEAESVNIDSTLDWKLAEILIDDARIAS